MAKQPSIEQDGTIIEALSNAMFRLNRPTSTSYCPDAVSGIGYFKFSTSSTSLTPGASSNALRAAATSTGCSKSATMLSEWARDVGIRTAVQLQR